MRVLPVEDGQITVTYRAPSLDIGAGGSVTRYVQAWSLKTNGCALSRTAQDSVTLLRKTSSDNPVPDGTPCLVLASTQSGSFAPHSSAGTIEGGSDSTCHGGLVKVLPVTDHPGVVAQDRRLRPQSDRRGLGAAVEQDLVGDRHRPGRTPRRQPVHRQCR